MYFIGDTHGDFVGLLAKIKWLNIKNSNLIQVGDFGLGFRSLNDDMTLIKKINNFLLKSSNHLYVIRGNHDDPSFFDGSIKRSNIHLLPDYSVISLEERTILLVGGAISIDRKIRRLGIDFWNEEPFVLDQIKLDSIISLNNPEIIVTHTAPSFVFPQSYGEIVFAYAKKDPVLLNELENERKLVDNFYKTLTKEKKPKDWYYGHFHQSHRERIQNIDFCLLNELEFTTKL